MTYGGQTQYAYAKVLPPGSSRWWIDTNIRTNQPLPGGNWGCDFSIGPVRLAAAFRSGSPTGPAVDLAACPATEALRAAGLLICPSDRSPSIQSGDSILCNGVYVGQRGKIESIDLLSGGAEVVATQGYRIDSPVWIGYQLFTGRSAGSYSCGYTTGGTRLAEKSFQVVG